MKISDLRPSFTIYLIGSQLNSLDEVGRVASEAGFVILRFEDLTSAFSEIASSPPHFIVMDIAEPKIDLKKAFREFHSQLPETHVFLFADLESRPRVAEYFSLGLYDVLWSPSVHAMEWTKSFDRAMERDYFMYMNEQLQSQSPSAPNLGGLSDLVLSLEKRHNAMDCIKDYLQFGSDTMNGCGALFMRFHGIKKVLATVMGHNISEVVWKGTGVDFSQDVEFHWPQLREPQTLEPLREMILEIFERSDYQAYPVEFARELVGIVVFLGDQPSPSQLETLALARNLVQTVAGYLELEKQIHSLSVRDATTDVMNRSHFLTRIQSEVMRSRRNEHALSLVLIAIDQYAGVLATKGPHEGQTLLKVFARILEKHSRVNDILARTGSDEFALLLPDTDNEGAIIKAERLRRMIEGADFSQALKSTSKLTISVGVAEYPSHCHDAEELLQAADEALFQVRSKTNKVCVAKPAENFAPDFQPVKLVTSR